MSRDPQKQAVFTEFARITKALAHGTRLELLDLLCQAPRSVEVLANLTGQSVATTSHHLKALRAGRLVTTEKHGSYVVYQLADKDVGEFWLAIQNLGHHHLADLRQAAKDFLRGAEAYEPVDRKVLLGRLRRGEVTLIDVRPEEEYRAGHLPGALSAPLEKLEDMLPLLPLDQEIVAYCRGPYCVLSLKAVKFLNSRQLRATRLLDGGPQIGRAHV